MKTIRPLSKSRRLTLMQVFHGVSLSLSAAEAMLRSAEIMSEGQVDGDPGNKSYSGSTLFTILLDERFDFGGEAHLDTLLACAKRSVLLRLRLLRLARLEAERKSTPYFVREMNAESVFRREGNRLLIDIEVECPLASLEEMEGRG